MAFDGDALLRPVTMPMVPPGPHELLLRVHACGVCRTDLHVVDGDLAAPVLPIVPGHEIVGTVLARGARTDAFAIGDRVGAAWLRSTCLHCRWCETGRENLCRDARFNGLHAHGGYATHVRVDARFCVALPDGYDDIHAAPLLCAGLIGFRALRAAGPDARRIGIYGFGAAGHLVAQAARAEGRDVFAFTRPGDTAAQALAMRLGARWAGDSTQRPPEPLEAALLFAPVGALVPKALADVEPGGTVVCGGIHMSDIPSFAYRDLWEERVIRSIANLTRDDASGFMALAARTPLACETETFALADANDALDRLREGRITGAAVLDCSVAP
ncbi:MAG: zinc-binding alcohol dehydrogenase family protein [Burkholderiales bacterium]|nr:MAG: zinc-binding alcohol dehydrogenase family protein [Burkholderiales bacterium]